MNSAYITEVHLVEKSGKPAVDRSGNPIMTGVDVKMFRHTWIRREFRTFFSKMAGNHAFAPSKFAAVNPFS